MTASLTIAVVGHTNTGKTSLLRTLLRDVTFGEVADAPGITRVNERGVIPVPGAGGITLIDTPGLEDSVALLAHLDAMAEAAGAGARRRDAGHAMLEAFLDSDAARTRFAPEARALEAVRGAACALYLIDARERMLARHRDELEILVRSGRPVIPVLNFTAAADAKTDAWIELLRRTSLHAIVSFDTVLYDVEGEARLWDAVRVLLGDAGPDARGAAGLVATHMALIRAARRDLRLASATVIADLLIDAAAAGRPVAVRDPHAIVAASEGLRDAARAAEVRAITALLALHRFRATDYREHPLPIEDGRWPLDLFSPEAMRQFGIRAAGLVATGAAVGFSVDVLLHGLSLGAGTAIGAAVGGLAGVVRTHGRRLYDRARGITDLRIADETLLLLAARAVLLVRSLFARGHAAMTTIETGRESAPLHRLADRLRGDPEIRRALRRARSVPAWSRLCDPDRFADEPGRQALLGALADRVGPLLSTDGGSAPDTRGDILSASATGD
ncbi:MAG: GTPase/DUF3482 domain-containing protein [Phycisphaeraceae bacterium]|nr:GTPase/DUF3482 domain-containing protein [Phycisphaeraceae bacterium]